jgi:hypothetical protein
MEGTPAAVAFLLGPAESSRPKMDHVSPEPLPSANSASSAALDLDLFTSDAPGAVPGSGTGDLVSDGSAAALPPPVAALLQGGSHAVAGQHSTDLGPIHQEEMAGAGGQLETPWAGAEEAWGGDIEAQDFFQEDVCKDLAPQDPSAPSAPNPWVPVDTADKPLETSETAWGDFGGAGAMGDDFGDLGFGAEGAEGMSQSAQVGESAAWDSGLVDGEARVELGQAAGGTRDITSDGLLEPVTGAAGSDGDSASAPLNPQSQSDLGHRVEADFGEFGQKWTQDAPLAQPAPAPAAGSAAASGAPAATGSALLDDLFEPPAGLGANGFSALEGAVGAGADEAEGAVASATSRTGIGGEEPGQPGAGDRGGWVLDGPGVNAVAADGTSETPGAELLLEAALCEVAGAAALLQGTLRAPWAPQRRLC